MRIGCSNTELNKFAINYMQPTIMYLLAAMCWVWLENDHGNPDYGLTIYMIGILVFTYHWGMSQYLVGKRKIIKFVLIFGLPIVIGMAGLLAMVL